MRKVTKAETTSAQSFSVLRFSHDKIKDLSKDKYFASGVIITIHDLSGKVLIDPTMIRDGLSQATIDALRQDFKESQTAMLEFKIKD